MRLLASLLFILAVFLAYCAGKAEADHSGNWLPLVPNTPLMQNIEADGLVTYCFNPRASNYPNFRAQVRDVSDGYTAFAGIDFLEVPSGSGCEVIHSMPDDHDCGSGCAAWILYANWPVLIEYKWQLGYADWRSTIGHEMGHGVLGLHEQYRDSGSISCTGKTWTVMDCGSGVRYPQTFDTTNGHLVLLPQLFNGGALDGNFVWYGSSDRATSRIAVVYGTYTGYRFFTGQYLPAKVCPNPYVCGGEALTLPLGACTDVFIGHENAARASWGRQLQRVGGTPC